MSDESQKQSTFSKLDDFISLAMTNRPMIMESKSKQKSASSSAINDGEKINRRVVEVVDNTESSDHWSFLEEIEAPMWADLSVCDLTDEETDDPWFNISHEFHRYSSSQLISTVFHPTNSICIQEPPSPKLPASVSKSRGKNYKIKQWEQRKCNAIPNKQHPVKNITKNYSMSTGSNNKMKPISKTGKLKENGVKACSSCGSNTTDLADKARPKSSSPSIKKQEQEYEHSLRSTLTSDHTTHQEKKSYEVSFQTSTETSKLLSSLRIGLRRSCATRPAARVVLANGGRCSEGSSTNSSVCAPSSKKHILGGAQNKLRALKTSAINVGSSSNSRGDNMIASKVTTKGKVQQHTSLGKVLMPQNINKQNQRVDKKYKKLDVGNASVAVIKEKASVTTTARQKDKSVVKTTQPAGCVQKASTRSMTQKNGTKKLIGLKEKTTNPSEDKDTAKPARKVYFR